MILSVRMLVLPVLTSVVALLSSLPAVEPQNTGSLVGGLCLSTPL